jgi:hypothetical protein
MKITLKKLRKIVQTISLLIGLISSVLTIVQFGRGTQEKNCEDNCCMEKNITNYN